MLQLHLADCDEAMQFYQNAFGGKKLSEQRNDDNSIIHAEMEIFGQVFAFSEIVYTAEEIVYGNGAEYWFQFEKGQIDAGRKAYNVLKEDAKEIPKFSTASDDGFWNEWCFCVTDKYGITWGLFC
jgi:uncharacterized glyoxalase superfamily protein PhnB